MATVVKANTTRASASTSGLVGFNLNDFAASGRQQVDAARQQAQGILDEARRQAVETEKTACEEGYAVGLKEGRRAAEKEFEQQVQAEVSKRLPAMQQTVEELAKKESEWLNQFADTLTAISVAMAEKIVRTRLETEPKIVLKWAEEALHHIRSARELVVAVHPETLVELGEDLENLLRAADLPDSSRLEPDESVERSGVVVRQEGGAVDVQLQAQLDKLTSMLGDG